MKHLLQLVVVIGVMMRLYDFGSHPASLNRDEAALAYNAWTIAMEGIDEWGRSYPLMFESFGDYKLPGYVYGVAGLTWLLGFDEWVVRLPSLLAGLGILMLSFLIGKRVFDDDLAGWWLTALVAVSPWAVFYSRMGWEAHVGLMLVIVVVTVLVYRVPFVGRGGVGVVGLYAVAVMTYNTPLLLAPALMLLALIWYSDWVDRLGYALVIGLIGLIGFVSLIPLTSQKQQITVFHDATIQAQQREGFVGADTVLERVYYQRLVYPGVQIASRALQSFGWDFLVLEGGDHPWQSVPLRGQITLVGYLLFVVGLGLVGVEVWYKNKTAMGWFVILLGGLAPAVVTVDAPHATRSLIFLWTSSVFGLYALMRYRRIWSVVLVMLVLEAGLFGYSYFVVFPDSMPASWTRGLEQLEGLGDDTPILLTTSDGGDIYSYQDYIYGLLYLGISARWYSDSVEYLPRDNAGLVRVARFAGVTIGKPADGDKNAMIFERQLDGVYVKQ